MGNNSPRILIATSDHNTGSYIARNILMPQGYEVEVVSSAIKILDTVPKRVPDLLIADLNLPDLSGKDLLVALTAQGYDFPVIVLSRDTQEGDVLQSFRLGAADFITLPAQETEIVSVIDRTIKHRYNQGNGDGLVGSIDQSHQELHQRLRQLCQLIIIGKEILTIKKLGRLFTQILEGAIQLSAAQRGFLLVRSKNQGEFILAAAYNLPASLNKFIGKPWNERLSLLTANSGKPLFFNEEIGMNIESPNIGQSYLFVPIKLNQTVNGILAVIRLKPEPFTLTHQRLLEGLLDFSSIALLSIPKNPKISTQPISKISAQIIKKTVEPTQIDKELQQKAKIEPPILDAFESIMTLAVEHNANLTPSQKFYLRKAQDNLIKSLKLLCTIESSS
jgi:FixJ family two-component response regulator